MMQRKADDGNLIKLSANTPIVAIDTGYNNTLSRALTNGTVYVGVSHNNYWIGSNSNRYINAISNGSMEFMSHDGAYGMGICVNVKPSTKYIFSYDANEKILIRTAEYNSNGGWITGINRGQVNPFTVTTGVNTTHILIIVCPAMEYTKQLITINNPVFVETA